MKILYVSPENITGGFDLFVRGHAEKGNSSRFVTFFPNQFGFDEDMCFDLAFMPHKKSIQKVRKFIKGLNRIDDIVDLDGNPPYWEPASKLTSFLINTRDAFNSSKINSIIDNNNLNEFDIYHFERGIDVYRDGRWIKKLAKQDKGIVCFYHGSDIRNRGVMKNVHRYSKLNLTSEIDLLDRLPGMCYLYLPLDTDIIKPVQRPEDGRIRICHAARNRYFKGSDLIESIVFDLKKTYPIDWIMIENMSHNEALKLKSKSDIFIDQITDKGGWGYGASSVESLALGLPTMSLINPNVASFLDSHPFINVNSENLRTELVKIIEDRQLRHEAGSKGREWVVKHHSIESVMNTLYGYYKDVGII